MFIRAFTAFVLALPILVAASILPRDRPVCNAGAALLRCTPHSGLCIGVEGLSISDQDHHQPCDGQIFFQWVVRPLLPIFSMATESAAPQNSP
jgi:hypothetical protein